MTIMMMSGYLRPWLLFQHHYLANGAPDSEDACSFYMKSISLNTLIILGFMPEVEIWPFCVCSVKNITNVSFNEKITGNVAQFPCDNTAFLFYCVLFFKNLLCFSFIFTARCTLVQSAVLRSHVVCLSVRL